MRKTSNNGLKLDLTENTPDSSVSRLPNLVEHAEGSGAQTFASTSGENLSGKLPNLVEGSMDYGSERRSSRYLEYRHHRHESNQPACQSDTGQASVVSDASVATTAYDQAVYRDSRNYRNYERKTAPEVFDDGDLADGRFESRIYPEEGLRYDQRHRDQRSYQESDLDAPYKRREASKLARTYPEDSLDTNRRYSRDLTDYEYASRYTEETLKLEAKKDHHNHPSSNVSTGYESGLKTRDSSYDLDDRSPAQQQDLVSRNYESKYHSVSKMYGTLPRYETGKTYQEPSYDSKYDERHYESSKYELTNSKSYERAKYDGSSSSRYQEKSCDETLKIGELVSSSSGGYGKKQSQEPEDGAPEKMNGYRKSNFEAYGVYSDPEDDHGFVTDKKTPQYTYKGVMVNASGECSLVDRKRNKDIRQTEVQRNPWCRPTILLLLLVLLVVIFVFIAGILLYFNYMSYKPRQPVNEGKDLNFASNNAEPCEKTYCAWGARCVVSESGRALCQCPLDCPAESEPVCGSDGLTYKNHCHLRQTSCQKRKNTRVNHEGPCAIDPCSKLSCPQGAQCERSRDGKEASCKCRESCPSVGDHEDSTPVCGSDALDYPSVCDLNRAACSKAANITVAFRGKCDPCAGVECSEPEVCQLDGSRQPACVCGEQCGLEFSPVCGSDGKTYSNECSMRQEACRSRLALRKIYNGACSSGVNPCDEEKCETYEQCEIDRYGIASCKCGPPCEPVMRPVCARGGVTYTSLCELKRHACSTKSNIEVAYTGTCGSRGPCSEKVCQWGAICAETAGTAICECPSCPAEFQPVCGDDGISYGNECKLQLEACQHRREIRVLYRGLCNGCENKKCEFYGECESDSAGEAKCVCPVCSNPKKESPEEARVCGSDGLTYDSECALKKASCATRKTITVAFMGDCELCANVECEHGAHCTAGVCVCPEECPEEIGESVCGSDTKTYKSECELQKVACERDPKLPPLHVIFYGECGEKSAVAVLTTTPPSPSVTRPSTSVVEVTNTLEREACKDIHCDFEATCELGQDKFPRCSCRFDCASISPENQHPICGSDLRIYSSLCAMKMEACQRQQDLRLRPLELCQGMEVKPCNGDSPLADSDGKEYDCGSGPERRDCPSNSYCHQTTRFARCCKKVQGIQVVKCADSWHGCCPDGKTPALGPDNAGCPSQCNCNRLGSISDVCNPETGQCECKPGVGGLKCNSCMPGYWGLPKISEGHQGCIPCGCSLFGSVREDCEQMTGRCVCKKDIQGQKCTICTDHNKILTPNGCQSAETVMAVGSSCNNFTCYSGGHCSEIGGPHCICPSSCPVELPAMPVCGSDGQTYDNECELRLYACRHQADVVTQAFGRCRDDPMVNTDFPVKRYTAVQYTQPAAAISPLSKSTRHLLVPEPDPRYYYTHRAHQETITIDRDNLKHGAAAAYRPTPATIRVVTPLLGDLCTDDKDCAIPNSECSEASCVCSEGYAETSDRQECFENYVTVMPTEEFRACVSNPCHATATCMDLPSATFACFCGPNHTGLLCDEEINRRDYEIPSFDGKSYVRMNRLKAYHKFSIEVEFKTYADNGIILYDQQKIDGTGDFVSLAIVDGYVQFRYNLGNGAVILVSPEKVAMNTFHRVAAKRYHKDGVLNFNDGESVVGQSQGMLKSLDLTQDTFIGNVPTNYSKVYDNIGTRNGFLGCIKRLKINRMPVDLENNGNDDILESYRVKECGDNACANLPCQNGATCQPIFEEDLCEGRECRVLERKGRNKNGNVNIVRCRGSQCTSIERRRGKKYGRKRCVAAKCDLDYSIEYAGGGAENEVKTIEPSVYKCICPPQFTGPNCEESLDPCMGEPCQHGATCDILPQGGYVCKCPPGRTGEHCEILDEELKELLIPEMSGDGFLEFPCLEGVAKAFHLELWFLTRNMDGLLLYNGQLNNGRGDFVSLNLVRGKLEFRFNLGSGIANITSPDQVSLDTWHCVRVSRLGREGLLQLDDGTVARGFSGSPLTELNLEMPLFIGGVKQWREVHRLAGAWTGLVGAVQRLMVNGKTYQNLAVGVTQHNTEIYDGLPCPSTENPCRNGGVCLPLLNSYLCKCANGYNGLHCEFFMGYAVNGLDIVDEPAVRFDGDNFLQFRHRFGRSTNTTNATLAEYYEESYSDYELDNLDYLEYGNYDYTERRGQQSNKFEVKIRTTHSEGLIGWVGRGKIEHLSLSIHSGHAVLTYKSKNEQTTLKSRERIDDGIFHHIKASRRRRTSMIQVDENLPVKISTETTLLTTNGKVFVGGKPGHRGFKGCLTDFIVDKRRLHLTRRKIGFCHDNDV